jgi:hypothetical protein
MLPVARPLPVHPQHPDIEVDVSPTQPERLPDAQAREGEHREQRAVRVPVVEHPRQIVALENFDAMRPPARFLGGFQQRCRVDGHPTTSYGEPEHLTQRQQREARGGPRHHPLVSRRPVRDSVRAHIDHVIDHQVGEPDYAQGRPRRGRTTPRDVAERCAHVVPASTAPTRRADPFHARARRSQPPQPSTRLLRRSCQTEPFTIPYRCRPPSPGAELDHVAQGLLGSAAT